MLQGSLENFALDEVLGLLSSTSKTGRLSLDGDRGSGTLSLVDGRLVDATVNYSCNGTSPEDIVFELLRYVAGSFSFDMCPVEDGDGGRDVAEVLASAEGRLADWRTIEAVVPSLDHAVKPAESLPAEEITINRAEWSTLRIITAGCPVSVVCEELGLGEVEGSRQIKGLAERGLVVVGPPETAPAAGRPATAVAAPTTEDSSRPSGIGAAPIPVRPLPPPSEPRATVVAAIAPASEAEPLGPPPSDSVAAATDASSEQASTDAGAAEVVDPSDALEWSAAEDVASPRPPMPAAPSIDELHELVEADADELPAPPAAADAVETAGSSNGKRGDREAESKPGGLLMRYLKSED
ncbi:MAG: DUF4388 domain-containing protein [Acidimicrobiia bacterium]|nr:DUF4388 domain-containing protein [Acidimicrobiia bacterium]